MKLGELASRLGAELRGDAELEVTGVKGIEEAGPTEITFVANPRYAGLARSTQAAAVLVEPEFQEITAATLRIKNPYLAFSRALGLFYQPPSYAPGIHSTAVIDPTAEIGEGAHIGAYVVIGPNVRLGPNATVLPHVVLYPGAQIGSHFFAHAHAVVRENCVLGDHITLENGAIIGADGFGFAKNEAGHWEKIPQSGPVRMGSQVDVQANACIDRATVGATEIGDGTKVDNLVQVGHGSRVGKDTLLCGQVGVAGSSGDWQQRDSGGTIGGCRPLRHWRWRDSDCAVGRVARCCAGQDDFRIAGVRQPCVAARSRHLSAAAGVAKASGSCREGRRGPVSTGNIATERREPVMRGCLRVRGGATGSDSSACAVGRLRLPFLSR